MGTEYRCREPGCGETFARGDTETNRRDRSRHEQREHLDSVHRAWPCPRDCGPLGKLYEEDALRGHIRRAHNINGSDLDQLWPYVMAERARLVDAIREQAETDGNVPPGGSATESVEAAGVVETAEDKPSTARRRNVYAELHELLDDWQTLQDTLDEAETELATKDAQLAELAMDNAALREENKLLRNGLTVVSDCVGSVLVQVGGDKALGSDPA